MRAIKSAASPVAAVGCSKKNATKVAYRELASPPVIAFARMGKLAASMAACRPVIRWAAAGCTPRVVPLAAPRVLVLKPPALKVKCAALRTRLRSVVQAVGAMDEPAITVAAKVSVLSRRVSAVRCAAAATMSKPAHQISAPGFIAKPVKAVAVKALAWAAAAAVEKDSDAATAICLRPATTPPLGRPSANATRAAEREVVPSVDRVLVTVMVCSPRSARTTVRATPTKVTSAKPVASTGVAVFVIQASVVVRVPMSSFAVMTDKPGVNSAPV